jgi:hypothetical protein
MHPLRWAPLATGLALALAVLAPPLARALGPEPAAYRLPLAQPTEWRVLVFGARFPSAVERKMVPFTVKATWQAGGVGGSKELAGSASWLKTAQLALSIPAGCTALAVTLDWQAPDVDLDLGLECAAPLLRLAPVLTVLRPERVRLDAQTAPFYQWLSAQYPEWWRGYPFWAEVHPAPRPPAKESP